MKRRGPGQGQGMGAKKNQPCPRPWTGAGRGIGPGACWFWGPGGPVTNTNHMDRYSKKDLGPEGSSINSAYRLLEAVDELESGMGMKSWKEVFQSFSETVR